MDARAADRYGGVIDERETAGEKEESEADGGFVSDLKGLPADMREATADADEKLRETTQEKHTLRAALDWPTLLIALAIAFVLALLIHFVVSPLVSVIAFLVLFGIAWYVVAHLRRSPPPKDDGRSDADRDAARERRADERTDA